MPQSAMGERSLLAFANDVSLYARRSIPRHLALVSAAMALTEERTHPEGTPPPRPAYASVAPRRRTMSTSAATSDSVVA